VANSLLLVDGAHVLYGQTVAVRGVSLGIGEGEVVALLGRNGAGKTSLAMAINRVVPLTRGRILFQGGDITNLPAYRVARLGILHVPEGRGILRDMTIRENLTLGRIAGTGRHDGVTASLDEVLAIFPWLSERLEQRAGSLSGGEQQMLVLGRAMLGRPRLMILDEPSLGLAPQIVKQIFGVFARFARSGMSVLLIEQNLALSLKVASRAYVLSNGRVAIEGDAEDLLHDPRLRNAYLGGDIAAP
jgi:branched-chain amino acid transport system ATP-binding protein